MKGVKWKFYAKLSALLMSLFAIFVTNSVNTNAAQLNFSTYSYFFYNTGESEKWTSEWNKLGGPNVSGYNLSLGPNAYVRYLRLNSSSVTTAGNYAAVNFKYNIVVAYPLNYTKRWDWHTENMSITSAKIGDYAYNPSNTSISFIQTDWEEWNGTYYCTQSNPCKMSTMTVFGSFYIANVTQTTGPLQITVGGLDPFWSANSTQYDSSRVYLEASDVTLDFTNTIDNSLLQYQINQNNTIIQQGAETNNLLQKQNQQDQQDREDLENQQSSAEDSADSSSEQAESTGSTLLQAFTGFVGALTSSSASDCFIDFNIMGYLNGGAVDLCQLSIPPALQAIGSLILIGFCVPLSIATAKKLIGLFRSFQS